MVPALAAANVSMVTENSAYFVDTGATRNSLQFHWPLVFPASFSILGLVLILCPRRAVPS